MRRPLVVQSLLLGVAFVEPKALAKQLAAFFLQNGNFVSAGGAMSLQVIPATTQVSIEMDAPGFAGLAVQSVGYTVTERDASELDPQDRPGVHVYVSRGSKKYLWEISRPINGVPCTVHNVGKLYVKPHQASVTTHHGNFYERGGCVACGSSCAPTGRSYTGTFGALVKDDSDTLFCLSNNHVFGDCNHTPVGQPILAPSSMDGRPGMPAPREICRHSKIVEFQSGAPALVKPCREDIAIAEVPDSDLVSSWQGDDTDGYDTPTDVADPETGMAVKKFGRTTGLTHGIMQSNQQILSMPYVSEFFDALVWFQDVWTVRYDGSDAFALGGDSGSLVVSEDGATAIGVLFAASPKGEIGLVVPLERVLRAFGGLSLVDGHNV